jgi:MerR family transcriptional regulator/heat shock protein HspR
VEIGQHSPVYGISVAAELTGVDVQMLRAYEARGLIEPQRSAGGTRRYSNHDLQVVDRISTLLGGGLNLAGIAQVFLLQAENRRLQTEIDQLRTALDEAAVPLSTGKAPRSRKEPVTG